jgi:K+-transporting ATPase ATPase A chain
VTVTGWLEIIATIGLAALCGWPAGAYIARVWTREPTWLDPVILPVERFIYGLAGIKPGKDQSWLEFALSFLAYAFMGALAVYILLRGQAWLPFNPARLSGLTPGVAFNTGVSFATNTGWEAYTGERALSQLSQMAGLTVQSFASASAGMAIAAALARAFSVSRKSGIGNFWVYVVRIHLYVLLPGALVLTLALCALGVPQTLLNAVHAHTLEGSHQTIILGPIASQKAISLLATVGGGFFNTNSAHPFEDPSSISNVLEAVAMTILPFGCVTAFGRVVSSRADARVLLCVMTMMLMAAATAVYAAESLALPALNMVGAAKGNMEGKEVRIGTPGSAAFVAISTGSAAGAMNANFESLTPASSGVAIFLIMIGEILPGGAGSGLCGMILVALLAVFVSGQMVGRTPEYLGKKIEAREIKLVVLACIVPSACILGFTAVAAVTPAALHSLSASGPHGLMEMLYAYASSSANNGSAFQGLRADTSYWSDTTSLAMVLGRFGSALPVLAIAGNLAAKPKLGPSGGTFPTDGPLFAVLLVGVILIMAGLQYFPALALGPMAEQLQMSDPIAR